MPAPPITESQSRRTPEVSITRLAVSDHPAFDGHEEVLACRDAASGLKGMIAIHSTQLGPALGGCRMWAYANDDEALNDVLRLSEGMSYKHAVAQTARGGGKAVIIGDPSHNKTPDLFRAFGRFVNKLGGQYITAEDVGVSVGDMTIVHEETGHVAGLPVELGGSGDPSPFTAYGVFCGIKAALRFQMGRPISDSRLLHGVTVAVQGLGHVGYALCKHLAESGAKLVVSDVNAECTKRVSDEFRATPVQPEEILDVNADVFAPCAMGAVLTTAAVQRLNATIVAGAANNQLACPEVATLLRDREILYAPDYVINAGGVINISHEGNGYDVVRAKAHTARIGQRLTRIFARASAENRTTANVADAMARAAFKGKTEELAP